MKDEYIIKPGLMLRFSSEALSTLSAFRQKDSEPEAGGILLGREYLGKEVVVETVTIPNYEDQAGSMWFQRERSKAQRIVNEAWNSSDRESIYLGEWHTHPQKIPIPSSRDRAMIRNMWNDTKMEIDFLILLIIGQEEDWVGVQTQKSLRQI